ncbi:MAG: HupE/UreJ family protein [Rickettsiales bacterium]|nr:HupE/UreJ family protein [Pseudomonadota bacterium]MDA0967218.1 HupE/UreJ family protein [Pseudomonadota bacterium]MDG4544121.1 HupE/UreJ family protein [Rickettsiales bacterium]MDG4546302.1 HupE/UreJ family protein [Rickettsiales bacterium]MDG4548445.1 HupE/UreJ family protein [Rickettsiales bacterium]
MKALFFTICIFLLTNQAFAHGMSEADKQKILDAGYWEYLELGASHMLTGYDHLLFLFGVIFFLTKFKDIVKFITAFTIGHSITLIFATLYGIQANYFLVDAVIALTVCYKGFDNLDGFKKYFQVKAPSLVGMVFAFGLIHGFGLSTRLQQLPLGDEGIVLRILAFNVGVEVGQIVALSVMLFILSGWRKTESFKHFSNASNVGLIIVGFLLLLMQLHGYEHTKYPDDYPLNKDDHYHVHKEMDAANAPKPSALEGYEKKIQLAPTAHDHGDGNVHTH